MWDIKNHQLKLWFQYLINLMSWISYSGSHRPAWARYGEYKFLPKQRWLHNLEVNIASIILKMFCYLHYFSTKYNVFEFFQHGSVVMLYHPCTHPVLVQRMRMVLKGCLFRHIITPYNLVPEDRVCIVFKYSE